MRFKKLWLTLGWVLVAVVAYLELMRNPPNVMHFTDSDKVEHMTAYGSMMFWFAQLISGSRQRLFAGVGLVVLGIVLEILQGLSGYRDFEYMDMVANSAGVVLGWVLVVGTPLGRSVAWVDGLLARMFAH